MNNNPYIVTYEDADGYKVWYVNGKRHRLDGPVYQWYDGQKEWYIYNYNVSSINNLLSWLKNE